MRRMFSEKQLHQIVAEVLSKNNVLSNIEYDSENEYLIFKKAIVTDKVIVSQSDNDDFSNIENGIGDTLQDALNAKQDALTNELDTDTLVNAVGFNADGKLVKGAVGGGGGGDLYYYSFLFTISNSLYCTFSVYTKVQSTHVPLGYNANTSIADVIDFLLLDAQLTDGTHPIYINATGYAINSSTERGAIEFIDCKTTADTIRVAFMSDSSQAVGRKYFNLIRSDTTHTCISTSRKL